MLDLLEQGAIPPVKSPVQQGQFTAAQAQSLKQAVASLRRTGTLPAGMPRELPGNQFQFPTPLLELAQIDRYDPATVAAKLPAQQRSCSPAATPTPRSAAPRKTTSPQAWRKPRRGSTTYTSTGLTTSSRRTSPGSRRPTTRHFRSPPSCGPR